MRHVFIFDFYRVFVVKTQIAAKLSATHPIASPFNEQLSAVAVYDYNDRPFLDVRYMDCQANAAKLSYHDGKVAKTEICEFL